MGLGAQIRPLLTYPELADSDYFALFESSTIGLTSLIMFPRFIYDDLPMLTFVYDELKGALRKYLDVVVRPESVCAPLDPHPQNEQIISKHCAKALNHGGPSLQEWITTTKERT